MTEKLERQPEALKSSSSEVPTRHVLAGFRVIDFTSFMAGPYSTRWLADLGAEVIKIEPVDGEWMRSMEPAREGASLFYGHLNAGKRSVALNLRDPEGAEIARSLCLAADIVVDAFRPGVMKRFGLDAHSLRSEKPELIYCSISGFGQNTTKAHWPAYASIVHASSGLDMALAQYRNAGDAQPVNSGIHFGDMLTSVFAALSVQVAIVDRERTGCGNTIDINLMDSVMNLLVYEVQNAQSARSAIPGIERVLRAKDGHVVVSPHSDRHLEALANCIGRTKFLDDPQFVSAEAWKNAALLDAVEAWTQQHSAAHCEDVLMSIGVPCACYRTVKDAMSDRQFEERQSFSTVEDAVGTFKVTNLPFALDGSKPQAGNRVHGVGEDTASVLGEVLGIQAKQLALLAAKGTIALAEQEEPTGTQSHTAGT